MTTYSPNPIPAHALLQCHRISLTPSTGQDGATQHFNLVVRESSQYASASLDILRENGDEISSNTASWPAAVDSLVEAPAASVIQAGSLLYPILLN